LFYIEEKTSKGKKEEHGLKGFWRFCTLKESFAKEENMGFLWWFLKGGLIGSGQASNQSITQHSMLWESH
jgi:hypothetical protein